MKINRHMTTTEITDAIERRAVVDFDDLTDDIATTFDARMHRRAAAAFADMASTADRGSIEEHRYIAASAMFNALADLADDITATEDEEEVEYSTEDMENIAVELGNVLIATTHDGITDALGVVISASLDELRSWIEE